MASISTTETSARESKTSKGMQQALARSLRTLNGAASNMRSARSIATSLYAVASSRRGTATAYCCLGKGCLQRNVNIYLEQLSVPSQEERGYDVEVNVPQGPAL